jgi:hypothetical protein
LTAWPPPFIEREFGGQHRRYQLPAENPMRLYRGIEGEGLTLAEARTARSSSRRHADPHAEHSSAWRRPATRSAPRSSGSSNDSARLLPTLSPALRGFEHRFRAAPLRWAA